MQNLVNIADEVTVPILNPECISQYEGLYVVRCYAADIRWEITDHSVFFELLACIHCTAVCSLFVFAPGNVQESLRVTNFIQIFPVFI
jgi:hypothetical protein